MPIIKESFIDEKGRNAIRIKWNSSYSGQFDLLFKDNRNIVKYKKTIVIESLF